MANEDTLTNKEFCESVKTELSKLGSYRCVFIEKSAKDLGDFLYIYELKDNQPIKGIGTAFTNNGKVEKSYVPTFVRNIRDSFIDCPVLN